ncbi:unnamed protein product [Paramecium pentaurelia]|uniref:Transmembrane protein n=1 Tax=Paramecium pentaurelia TaxID=43138 RepID=A0A8S1WIH1_9CILI|nr:unnamed protein product [Paramecium pentaurelia]
MLSKYYSLQFRYIFYYYYIMQFYKKYSLQFKIVIQMLLIFQYNNMIIWMMKSVDKIQSNKLNQLFQQFIG